MASRVIYTVFPLHLKSRGFWKGWWYPKHNENIDNNIEIVGLRNMGEKSLFSGNFWGANPCIRVLLKHRHEKSYTIKTGYISNYALILLTEEIVNENIPIIFFNFHLPFKNFYLS